MLGELTSRMAESIAVSQAKKYLLPINRCGIEIIGVGSDPLPHQIERLVESIIRNWRD